jgi:hypothetical protein
MRQLLEGKSKRKKCGNFGFLNTQDNYGKMIEKLFNHFATMILPQ